MKTTIFIIHILLFMACARESGREDHEAEGPGTLRHSGSEIDRNDSSSLMLTDSQIRLANITLQRVARKPVGETIIVNGQLKADEDKSQVISSRAAGRVEKLFIKETGQAIRQGEPLYTLYSEELLTLQNEYLLAREQYESLGGTEKRYKSFLEAAERKLALYGLSKRQISQLSRNTALAQVTLQAPSSGIVTEIDVVEGQYVAEGASLYKMEDVRSLWVEAELYPDEIPLVKVGDKIRVVVSGTESESIDARVTFVSPEFKNNSQIAVARASIDNPENQFKPGQFAQVYVTPTSRIAMAVPSDAVIRDEHGAHVYVQSGHNTFRPRVVKTGVENFDEVEITRGLEEGDTIAASGAYLLYSEFVLRKGLNPMAHNH